MLFVLSIIRFKRGKELAQFKERGLCWLAGLLAPVVLMSMTSICLAQGDTWTTKTDMPTARDPSTSAVDGKIYAFGGSNNGSPYLGFSIVEEYDPATDSWTTKTDMPTARFGSSASTVNGKIYVIGGRESGSGTLYSTIEEYDPATDIWTTKTGMPTARMWLSTSVVNGKIYAIGGEQFIHGGVLSAVEEYDPVTDTWTTKTDMPTARYGLSTSVVNGKIYAIGGSNSGSLSTVEEYNPSNDTWTTKTNMPTARKWLSSSMVNDIIFAIGGLSSGGSTYGTVEAYNPVTDTWTTRTEMPTRRFLLSTSMVGGKIYAIGGIPSPNAATISTVEEYNPHNDLIGLVENVNVGRSYAIPGVDNVLITTKLNNPIGITLFAEIQAPDQTPVDSVELFDDGLHNDGGAGDSLFANSWLVPPVEESNYYIDLQVTRVDSDTVVNHLNNMALFTTIGPVVVEDYDITSTDTVPNPGDQIRFKLKLLNDGLTATAINIMAMISTTDSCISEISNNSTDFGDIPAGGSVIPASVFQSYVVEINPNCPGDTDVWFNVDIYSDGNFFWSDSFAFHIYNVTAILDEQNSLPDKYALHQNYPNPFNPNTKILYSVPEESLINIKIYNTLGEEVAVLVNENKAAGNYEVEFDAANLPSGIYFYKLQAGEYINTKKMILLK